MDAHVTELDRPRPRQRGNRRHSGLAGQLAGDKALHGPRAVDALLGVAITAPIAGARRFALVATAASIAATVAYLALAAPAAPGTGFLPTGLLLVFPLGIGAACSVNGAVAGLVLCLAGAVLGVAVDLVASFDPVTTARRGGDRRRVGGLVWRSDPHRAREHAQVLKLTVSDSITELRQMVIALAGGKRARPGQLERLVERARASGVRVRVEVAGDRAVLTPDVEHTAYRLVQEALTNAARHADGAEVFVLVDFGRSGVTLEVANSRPSRPSSIDNGSGQGLVGMRERAEASGGRLSVRAEPSGGFTVDVWLPSGR